jgi:hypothetical protein
MKMKRTRIAIATALLLPVVAAIVVHLVRASAVSTHKIALLRTPQEGIQPQTVLDPAGVLHMIYFKGDAAAGDIEYVKRGPAASDFSQPLRVNSEPHSAVAVGSVRGPQLAVGRNGRAYVIWFGPQAPAGDSDSTMPVYFARLNDSGTAFEPQRNLMQYAKGGDGGISVAADALGNVYSVWHAMSEVPGEDHRRVYLARSSDDGKNFAREVPVSPAVLGACGCCGMRAFVDQRGTLYILYRAAAQNIHRDITLLVSTDHATSFRASSVAPWELNACPMSTAYLSEGGRQVLAAWEKAGEVYFDRIDPASFKLSPSVAAPGDAKNRKHPAVAATADGQTLLAWTEGTGWSKGGSLAWQLFDKSGSPTGEIGRAPGIPVWGLPSVFADSQGNFTIVY